MINFVQVLQFILIPKMMMIMIEMKILRLYLKIANLIWLVFKTVALRRNQKIYDNFYIPKNSKEALTVSYEKFLACALSLESEYDRLYPTKKEDNNLYADVYEVFQNSADELEMLFIAIKENKLTSRNSKIIF